MEKRNIFYIMGIDWDWIYQRPQIFAEALADDYQVTVLFPRSILKWRKKEAFSLKKNIDFRVLWTFPFQEKNFFIGKLASWLNYRKTKDISKYEIVYVGYPLYARYITVDYRGKIVYDCMDNHEALYPDQKRVGKVVEQERKLITKSNLVIVSSLKLADKIKAIHACARPVIVRNAVNINDIGKIKETGIKSKYRICYIGTISEWFDYEVLTASLNELDNIEYHLIGPTLKQIETAGIIYDGVIVHEKLSGAIKDYDCLIMPFVLNDIVTAVDPVKLYEYVAFGKCIISVYYPEVEPFSELVYFYHSVEEYIDIVKELAGKGFPPKYSKKQQEEFLNENTWQRRYSDLKHEIELMED